VKHAALVGLYLFVTLVYDGGADAFDPDRFVREAVEDGDLIAGATIALESYGWQLYGFIVRQVQANEVDEVFARVADEMLRGLRELVTRTRVRDWIYTLVHGAWIRTQAKDPRRPLEGAPAFARWVQQLAAGFGRAVGVRGSTSGGGRPLVVAGEGSKRKTHAIAASSIRGRTPARIGMDRVAMQRIG
jgi:hypothetical protein